MSLPLSGIRVLDLSRVLAGPLVGQMLADLGAEVIKVERPGGGDDSRQYGPPFLAGDIGKETGESGFYLAANRNKKSITINISSREGQVLVRRLAAGSDVLLENFLVGTLARYGLDHDSIRQINPRIIYCSITGYGQSGPYSARPGYDAIFQAMGGLMSVCGYPDNMPGGGPMKVGISIADVLTSLYASIGVVTALYHRDRPDGPGTGQHIDMALLDSQVATMTTAAVQYLVSGQVMARRGNGGNGGIPSQTFMCSDGEIILTIGNDTQWVRFCAALGHPELADDPRFAKGVDRIINRPTLIPLIEHIFLTDTKSAWLNRLLAADIPCGPINDLAQVFADEQVRYRATAVKVPHPLSDDLRLVANPIRFSETPLTKYDAPPMVGQHTDEILRDMLGMDDAAIAELKTAKAV